jgi:hypothetical protein
MTPRYLMAVMKQDSKELRLENATHDPIGRHDSW